MTRIVTYVFVAGPVEAVQAGKVDIDANPRRAVAVYSCAGATAIRRRGSRPRTHRGTTVSAAIRDISARKRMEAAAKLFAERLSSAVENIQDAFLDEPGDRVR